MGMQSKDNEARPKYESTFHHLKKTSPLQLVSGLLHVVKSNADAGTQKFSLLLLRTLLTSVDDDGVIFVLKLSHDVQVELRKELLSLFDVPRPLMVMKTASDVVSDYAKVIYDAGWFVLLF